MILMEEFQTVNEIVSQSIKTTSLWSVVISSVVFILYTLIIKVVDYFKNKNKDKPIIEMANAIKLISNNVESLNKILDKTFKDAEVKEISRVNNIIPVGFNALRSAVCARTVSVIISNDLDGRDLVKQSIYKTVSTEYYRLYSIFSAYEIAGVNVATRLKEDWIEVVANECTNIVYSEGDSTRRIKKVVDKLETLCEEYSVYVNNKVFNH